MSFQAEKVRLELCRSSQIVQLNLNRTCQDLDSDLDIVLNGIHLNLYPKEICDGVLNICVSDRWKQN